MAGKFIDFRDLFDRSATLATELGQLYSNNFPVQIFIDYKSLFDVVSKSSSTSKKRVMLSIAAACEGFKDKIISYIKFVRISHNLADELTKAMSQASLRDSV